MFEPGDQVKEKTLRRCALAECNGRRVIVYERISGCSLPDCGLIVIVGAVKSKVGAEDGITGELLITSASIGVF